VVFGGLTQAGAGITGDVERFHPATNSWTSLALMPTPPRFHAGAATTTDGSILVVGGYPAGADATNTVEAYNPATNTWSMRASLPNNAAGPGVVRGPDGTIYVFGGYPGCCFNYNNTVYAYNQVTDSWTLRAPMPTPREAPAVALAADGKIYVVGGNGSGPVDKVVEVYDPVANAWQSKAPAPVGIGGVPLISAPNGKLYVFGYDETGGALEYDTGADTWTPVEPMPTPRRMPAGALAGDGNIYIVGGIVDSTAQTTAANERATFGGVGADMSVSLTDAPDPVWHGDNVTYSATVANAGPETATGVRLTTTMPAQGAKLGSATPSQGSCTLAKETVTCDLGVIAVGQNATVTIVAKAQKKGTLATTAAVTAQPSDPNSQNNNAAETTTVT
jgi:uncharacterized repeat protein (TIGR01451 family)